MYIRTGYDEVVDVESLTRLSDGVVDVKPFLVSQNTLGNEKTANSKSQRPNVKWISFVFQVCYVCMVPGI